MEKNKVLVTELPLPFNEKDLEELKNEKCIIDYLFWIMDRLYLFMMIIGGKSKERQIICKIKRVL